MKVYVNSRDFKVFLSITHKYKRFLVYTGLKTTEKFEGMMFPRSDKSARVKTARLAKIFSEVEEYILTHEKESVECLKEHIKELIVGAKRPSGKTLHDYILELSNKKKAENTKRLYKHIASIVEKFDKSCKVSDIDKHWLQRYVDYHRGRGRKDNGINADLIIIKSALKKAVEEGIIDKYKTRGFSLPHEETKKRCLTLSQIREIRDITPESNKQTIYRDFFMLGFYLIGINVSDLLMLKEEDYKDGRISYKRNKTGRIYDIKVEPEAKEIIDKYRGDGEGLLLNFLSASNHDVHNFTLCANALLRKLGKTRGKGKAIEPKISTYWNRHSWATFAAQIGISMETIGRALGHSIWDNAVTAIYIKYDHRVIDEANRRVIDYVNGDLATQAK